MPSKYQIPIRFKTQAALLYPVSIMVFGLPYTEPQLPPKVITTSVASQPSSTPKVTINSLPSQLENRLPYQFISIKVPSAPSGTPAPRIAVYNYPKFDSKAEPIFVRATPPVQQLTPNAPVIRVYDYPPPPVNKAAFDARIVKPTVLPPVIVPTVNIVSVAVPTSAVGSTFQVAHGLANTPQLIFAILSGRTEGVDTVAVDHTRKSFGAATQPLNSGKLTQFCVGTESDNNVALTSSSATLEPNIAAVMKNGTNPNTHAIAGSCAIQSIDATNITFVIKTQFDQSYRLILQIFADDLGFTWLQMSNYNAPLVSGTQAITGVGFKPDFVLFFGPHFSQGVQQGHIEGSSGTFIGCCDKNLSQWALASGVNDNGGGTLITSAGRARSYMKDGQCMAILSANHSAFNSVAALQSLDNDGFTLNWTINLDAGQTVGRDYIALCIQGPSFLVGNYLSQLDLAEHQVVSGIPQPEGILIASANKPVSVLNTTDHNENWSIGFVSALFSIKNELQYIGQKDAPWTPNTTAYTAIQYDNSYINLDITGAVVGKASVTTIVSDGFKITHSVADPAQNFIGYIAYSRAIPPVTRTTVTKTVKPNGGGDYTSLNAALQGELLNNKNLYLHNIILELDCYAGSDTTPVKFPSYNDPVVKGRGYISTDSNYIYVKAVDGHVGLMDYSGSKYLLDLVSVHSSRPFQVNLENVFLEQLQIRLTVSDGSEGAAYNMATTGLVAPTKWVFKNCIAKAVLSNNSTAFGFEPPNIQFDVAGVKVYYINCIAYDFLSRDNQFSGFQTYNCGNQLIVHMNCTAVNCQQGYQDHADVIHINCAALGCDNGWNTALAALHPGPNPASDYNFSTCGPPSLGEVGYPGTDLEVAVDPHGPHSVGGLPAYVQDLLNGIPIPVPGDLALIGQGVDLSTNPYFPFNTDVRGVVRTAPWTIGAFQVDAATPATQSVRWTWVGGVTDTHAVISIKLNLTEPNVKLRLSTDPLMASYGTYGPVATNSNNVASFNVGIAPGINYYQVEIGGVPIGPINSFTGFPKADVPASFSFVCGGCADTGSNTNLYTYLKSLNPLLYINYGDLHYWNITGNDITLYRKAIETSMLSPKRRDMLSTMAMDWVWDDHDYGKDNSDSTSPSRPAAVASYRENFPSYTLPAVDGAIYHSFVIGRIRFVLTDLRSNRVPDGSMMGDIQLTWFKNELLTAKLKGELVFWFSTVPWIAPTGDNFFDNWGGFVLERQQISDFIEKNGLANQVVIFCGDMHSCAIDDGTHDKYNTDGTGNGCVVFLPFPENQTTQVYGGAYTQGPVTHSGARLMGFAGHVTVTDNGLDLTVKFDVVNELGTVLTFSKKFIGLAPNIYIAEGDPSSVTFTGETPAATTYSVEKPATTNYNVETPANTQYTIEKPIDTKYQGE